MGKDEERGEEKRAQYINVRERIEGEATGVPGGRVAERVCSIAMSNLMGDDGEYKNNER